MGYTESYMEWLTVEGRIPDYGRGNIVNQRDVILQRLRHAGIHGVCATTLLQLHIPRYAARIAELRQQHQIVSEPCTQHSHDSRQIQYRLVIGEQAPLWKET